MRQQTKLHRRRRRESLVVLEDTLCEQVGSRLADVDRHSNHRDGTYPLAPNPATSCYGSGPVRFPPGLRLDRRDEELPQWAAWVAKHFPDLKIPTATQGGIAGISRSTPCCSRIPRFASGMSRFGPTSPGRLT